LIRRHVNDLVRRRLEEKIPSHPRMHEDGLTVTTTTDNDIAVALIHKTEPFQLMVRHLET